MMTPQQGAMAPIANIVVEREPGKGYQVTCANGECPEERKAGALAVLDHLGQPDPNGPQEYTRWVGPIAPTGDYVGINVKIMPNGEACYHQAWFQVPRSSARFVRPSALLPYVLIAFVTLFFAGMIVGYRWRPTATPSAISAPGKTKGAAPSVRQEPEAVLAKLDDNLASSRELRAKVLEYLSQEGFADLSKQVVDVKRSIKLISDLDKTPPPTETIRLSNVEVAKLMNLLQTLQEWQSLKMVPKRE